MRGLFLTHYATTWDSQCILIPPLRWKGRKGKHIYLLSSWECQPMCCFADDDETLDYKLGYFAMVVAVHRALLLIRGEWYPFMIACGGGSSWWWRWPSWCWQWWSWTWGGRSWSSISILFNKWVGNFFGLCQFFSCLVLVWTMPIRKCAPFYKRRQIEKKEMEEYIFCHHTLSRCTGAPYEEPFNAPRNSAGNIRGL